MSIRKAKFELSLISIRILFSAHHPTRLIKKIDYVRTHIRTHEPFGYIVLSPGMEFPSPSPDQIVFVFVYVFVNFCCSKISMSAVESTFDSAKV